MDASKLESPAMAEADPTREERAASVVKDLEHAVKHNAPIPHTLIDQVRALLGSSRPDPTVQG